MSSENTYEGRFLKLSNDKGKKYDKHYSKDSLGKYKSSTASNYAKPQGNFSNIKHGKPVKYYTGSLFSGKSIPWWIWLIIGLLILLIVLIIALS